MVAVHWACCATCQGRPASFLGLSRCGQKSAGPGTENVTPVLALGLISRKTGRKSLTPLSLGVLACKIDIIMPFCRDVVRIERKIPSYALHVHKDKVSLTFVAYLSCHHFSEPSIFLLGCRIIQSVPCGELWRGWGLEKWGR